MATVESGMPYSWAIFHVYLFYFCPLLSWPLVFLLFSCLCVFLFSYTFCSVWITISKYNSVWQISQHFSVYKTCAFLSLTFTGTGSTHCDLVHIMLASCMFGAQKEIHWRITSLLCSWKNFKGCTKCILMRFLFK
jgi:hypothetical protein